MMKINLSEKFKKWLTRSSVNKVTSVFKYAIITELILLIITIICLCSVINLKKENKQLKEKLNSQTAHIETIYTDVLEPLGL
jgi:hypothetical protein